MSFSSFRTRCEPRENCRALPCSAMRFSARFSCDRLASAPASSAARSWWQRSSLPASRCSKVAVAQDRRMRCAASPTPSPSFLACVWSTRECPARRGPARSSQSRGRHKRPRITPLGHLIAAPCVQSGPHALATPATSSRMRCWSAARSHSDQPAAEPRPTQESAAERAFGMIHHLHHRREQGPRLRDRAQTRRAWTDGRLRSPRA